jgi:acetyltransferase-like isoleucine patch superfamily enzyme
VNELIASIKNIIRLILIRKKFPSSVIYRGAIVNSGSILGKYSVIFGNVTIVDSNLGSYSYVQSKSTIFNADIDSFCSIASDVVIGLASHPTTMVSTSPVFYDNQQPLPRFFTKHRLFTQNLPRTIIGPDVWIGHRALVKAGVKIGVGAVIGAGAIVTKDIPPYTIAAGNPCRPIRQRFSEDISMRLMKSNWWELDDSELIILAPLFNDPVSLLERLDLIK